MKKLLFMVILQLLAPLVLRAQQNTANDIDDRRLTGGFLFQYINSDFKIYKRPYWRSPYDDPATGLPITDSLNSIRSVSKPGFGLGFLTNLKLGNNADLRFSPGLAFTDKQVDFTYASSSPQGVPLISRVVQATTIDLPFGIKIKSDQHNNFRAYFMTGFKYSSSIVSKKKTDDSSNPLLEKLLKVNQNALSYEAGIGLDLYFPFFKMSPEIKFSQSAGNVLKRDSGPYSFPIDKLFLHSLQFSLFFQ